MASRNPVLSAWLVVALFLCRVYAMEFDDKGVAPAHDICSRLKPDVETGRVRSPNCATTSSSESDDGPTSVYDPLPNGEYPGVIFRQQRGPDDKIITEMGHLMTRGWTLLAEACHKCGVRTKF